MVSYLNYETLNQKKKKTTHKNERSIKNHKKTTYKDVNTAVWLNIL